MMWRGVFHDGSPHPEFSRKTAFRRVVVLQRMRDPASRQYLPARRGICSHVSPPIFVPAPGTKAGETVAVRLGLDLEDVDSALEGFAT
jgi:hypothetical protein